MMSSEPEGEATSTEWVPRRKVVVVIGIDNYEHLQRLRCAVSDALGVQNLLVEQFGFEAPIPPLTNEKATKRAIEALIEDELRKLLDQEDALVLFFAGHGTTRVANLHGTTVETGYIAPVEASSPDQFSDLIDMNDFLRKAGMLPGRHILVVLDACHSGMALGAAMAQYRSADTYIPRLASSRSRRVITSARRDELALDNGPALGHSLFTGTMIQALSSGEADIDKNGIVTFSELALYLQQRVAQTSGSRQTPDYGAFHLDERGELVFARLEGAPMPVPVPVPAPAPAADPVRELASAPVTEPASWRTKLRRAFWIAPPVALVILGLVLAMLYLPRVDLDSIQPQSGAIVVAGPWLFASESRAARNALCEALDQARHDDEPKVICQSLPLAGATKMTLREKALKAGASLLVFVDDQNKATIVPLGTLSEHELVGHGLPTLSLDSSRPKTAQQMAPILRSLAEIAEGARRVNRMRCSSVQADDPLSLLRLALFTNLYTNDCEVKDVSPQKLLDGCQKGVNQDSECRLAHYVATIRFPSGLGSQQDPLLIIGRDACFGGRLDEVDQAMDKLWTAPSACIKLTASILAACLLSDQKTLDAGGQARVERIASFGNDEELGECSPVLIGRTVGERAWWWAKGQQWDRAASDYKKAWDLIYDPLYLLNLTEILLHQKRTQEALSKLAMLKQEPSLGDRHRIQEALLSWIAQRQAGNMQTVKVAGIRLLDLYRSYGVDKRVYNDANDPVLRPLACPESGKACALDVLGIEKTSRSTEELETALAIGK